MSHPVRGLAEANDQSMILELHSKTFPLFSPRFIFRISPRYVETAENNIHGPDYLEDLVDKSIFEWPVSSVIGYVDQVFCYHHVL